LKDKIIQENLIHKWQSSKHSRVSILIRNNSFVGIAYGAVSRIKAGRPRYCCSITGRGKEFILSAKL
jgi:hypothetical protein